jgi:hypothetical protein
MTATGKLHHRICPHVPGPHDDLVSRPHGAPTIRSGDPGEGAPAFVKQSRMLPWPSWGEKGYGGVSIEAVALRSEAAKTGHDRKALPFPRVRPPCDRLYRVRPSGSCLLGTAIEGLPGVEAAYIFGSHAAGTDAAGSDVDRLVIGRPDRVALSERLAPVERIIGRDVNVVTRTEPQLRERRRADAFWRQVLGKPMIHVAGRESSF